MAIIKSYTDIEQSLKLAEILPLESADMYWWYSGKRHYIEAMDDGDFNEGEGHIRAWSLAALLNIIQKTTPYKMEHFGDKKVQLTCVLGDKPWELIISDFNNEVDACYEMILKLYELNLL